MSGEKKFAVLIDSDNVSDKYIKIILDEISNEGIVTYKRIYGDWTKPTQAAWKAVLLNYSLTPVQQYAYTTGKNATDSAMIIDAMDILYSGNVDGFALVSSDSDFTRLAARLRESGMIVVGMGERKTPSPFIAACSKFKYLDVLARSDTPKPFAQIDKGDAIESIKRAVVTIMEENSDEDGWTFVGDIGNTLNKRYPDFDVRNFGYSKLAPFIKSLGIFEERIEHTANNGRLAYLRVRPANAPETQVPETPETEAPAASGARRRSQSGRQPARPAAKPEVKAPEVPTVGADLPEVKMLAQVVAAAYGEPLPAEPAKPAEPEKAAEAPAEKAAEPEKAADHGQLCP